MKKNNLPDVAVMISKMQEQLASMERKIDALVRQPSGRPAEVKHFPGHNDDYRQRILFKAICADCKKECEVPFRPSGERPVYCKDCFSKRKTRGVFEEKSGYRPRHGGERRKPVEKKKPHVFRRKKRA